MLLLKRVHEETDTMRDSMPRVAAARILRGSGRQSHNVVSMPRSGAVTSLKGEDWMLFLVAALVSCLVF